MKYYRSNGAEISPCILSRARFALRLTKFEPLNDKYCSKEYWEEAVLAVGKYNERIQPWRSKIAIDDHEKFMPARKPKS